MSGLRGICAEKFQVENGPTHDEGGGQWVDDRSARTKKGMPGREGRHGGDHESKAMNNAVFFNGLPPGMDTEDQEVTDQRKMGMSYNGNNPSRYASGDVTNDECSPQNLKDGFSRKAYAPTDDMYTNEHCDTFYSEAKVDGEVGFVERGNVLDRL